MKGVKHVHEETRRRIAATQLAFGMREHTCRSCCGCVTIQAEGCGGAWALPFQRALCVALTGERLSGKLVLSDRGS